MKRILVALAAIIELVAAAGIATADLGSIHVGLVALGLFVYFVSELL